MSHQRCIDAGRHVCQVPSGPLRMREDFTAQLAEAKARGDAILSADSDTDEVRCDECDWTPSGFFAAPCERHACPSCGHLEHDTEDGCSKPDPFTGWCECEGIADVSDA